MLGPRCVCLMCHSLKHSMLYYSHCSTNGHHLSGPWRHLSLAQKIHRLSPLLLSVSPPWAEDHPSLMFVLPVTGANSRLVTAHPLGDSVATFYKHRQECLPLALQKAVSEQNLFLEMQHSDFFFSKSKVWISVLFRSPRDIMAEKMHFFSQGTWSHCPYRWQWVFC